MSVKKLLKKLVCFSLAAALSCTAMFGVISCKAKTDFTVGIFVNLPNTARSIKPRRAFGTRLKKNSPRRVKPLR